MKANELRIGNLVSPPIGEEKHIGQIELITQDNCEFYLIDDNYEEYLSPTQWMEIKYLDGLEITEEWLLKMGFFKSMNNINYFLSPFKDSSDYFFEMMLYDIKEKEFIINSSDYNGFNVQLHYVHQLQNLYFSLTGEELTIGGQDEK